MKLGGPKAYGPKLDFSAAKAALERGVTPVPVRIVASIAPKWPSFGDEYATLKLIKKSAVAAIKTMNIQEYEEAVCHFFDSLYELEGARAKGDVLIAFRIARTTARETVVYIDRLTKSMPGTAEATLLLTISEKTKQCIFQRFTDGAKTHSKVGPAIVKFSWMKEGCETIYALDDKIVNEAEWQQRVGKNTA